MSGLNPQKTAESLAAVFARFERRNSIEKRRNDSRSEVINITGSGKFVRRGLDRVLKCFGNRHMHVVISFDDQKDNKDEA